ncbi:bifunctional UDP-N-acetylglucosamine pyrophosphorylase / Glucosamine-1-phosphate N-acetyltransferase [Paenibacillus sp. yr247]|uniref:bifunctional UDP-N-acetylglucosamine diphosphorylase/glucosamine-1-phosphate N-acetyltransferase GlmU n=1 Tax=Paenibacillus sp. yr247 TaxID=1761880 RepID=UPI00088FC3DA|nr:bifunctional UDP-N-acetylglucosamine diphosphorylase/glucosamine-1-phosphate N-acetyltransferase GlmU [Paenibacillus sp. yr247]SDO49375.1 bifunctional UDP-N-acetylglucosamine pyrophosphorylase / Glucosamine-1-phosphate N-acetyltransferase [Paenibacillus sp. yr247]
MNETFAIVLAAGLGTRMKSKIHKVLHPLCGKPMIRHVTDSLRTTGVGRLLVVVGTYAEQIEQELESEVEYVRQDQQLGTGHAVMQAREVIGNLEGYTLVCYGDTPLVTSDTYKLLLSVHQESGSAVTMLTAVVENPTGLGRIVRNEAGEVLRIVEEKDASTDEKRIREINPGLYCFTNSVLFRALDQVQNHNAQGEYYLTDCIQIIKKMGHTVKSLAVSNAHEVLGINDRIQLAQLNKMLRDTINESHMRNGVTLIDPHTTYIDSKVSIGEDTVIGPGVTLSGSTSIGKGCYIGSGSQIESSTLGEQITIHSSIIRDSVIAEEASIGPFAFIRPGSVIGKGVKVGDFVEVKNSTIGEGSKIPHLAYVGDSDIGQNTNIGCGVITVNFDGVNKHRTTVGDDSFVGSNTNLIAPVTIGKEVYIATGSTITNDVPDGAFAIARERQVTKANYVKHLRGRLLNAGKRELTINR